MPRKEKQTQAGASFSTVQKYLVARRRTSFSEVSQFWPNVKIVSIEIII